MSKARRIADTGTVTDTISIADMSATPLVERTAYGNGTDITPLINAAGAALRSRNANARGTIVIPAGKWRMASAADDDKIAGHHIVGAGSQTTHVYFDALNGVMFALDGENNTAGWSGGGISRMRLILGAVSSASPCSAIALDGVTVGPTVAEPDDYWFDDIYINAESPGTRRWYNGFFVYGNERTSPQGIRVGNVRSLHVFDCTNIGIYMSNVVQWNLDNIGTYTGVGTGNDIHITGGGASNTNSTQVVAHNVACSGTLNISNCSNVSIFAKAGSIATSGADYIFGFIAKSGALSGTFGANSYVVVH